MTNITQSLKVILLAVILSFGISYVFAWAPPTAPPTAGNSAAPLNTSNNDQTKNGNLFLNALGITNPAPGALNVTGGGVFGGNVGIGTMSPNALLTLSGGKMLLKQNVVTGTTGANNIGLAIDTGATTGEAASMGIFREAVNGASSLVFKNWNGADTVETARISSNGNLTTTGVICDSTGCIGGGGIPPGSHAGCILVSKDDAGNLEWKDRLSGGACPTLAERCTAAGGQSVDGGGNCIYTYNTPVATFGWGREIRNNDSKYICANMGGHPTWAYLSHTTSTHGTACGGDYGLVYWNGTTFVNWGQFGGICGGNVTVDTTVTCKVPMPM